MSLVEDDAGVPLQERVAHGLPQQHPVGHELEYGAPGGAILKTDRIPHLLAHHHVHLLADSLRDRHGRHTSRLGAGDHLASLCEYGHQELRDLGGLPGSRLALHDHHLVLTHILQQLILELVDRELLPLLEDVVVPLTERLPRERVQTVEAG